MDGTEGKADKPTIPVRGFHPLLSITAGIGRQTMSRVIDDLNNPHLT